MEKTRRWKGRKKEMKVRSDSFTFFTILNDEGWRKQEDGGKKERNEGKNTRQHRVPC